MCGDYWKWFTEDEIQRFNEVRPERDARRDLWARLVVAIERDALERPEIMRLFGLSAARADNVRKTVMRGRGWLW